MMHEAIDVRGILHLACNDMSKMEERIQARALKENRLDDANLDTIRHRFETYINETQPVLDKYDPGLINDIDSTQTPIEVLADIVNIIGKIN